MKEKQNSIRFFFSRIADYITLSICFLLTSLPMVTVATSAIALYDTVAHCICFGEDEITQRYFATFRRELMRGVALTVIWAAAGFMLYLGYQIIHSNVSAGSLWLVLQVVYLITLLFPLGLTFWQISLESRIVYTFKQLCINAIAVTVLHLPQTVAVALLLAGALALIMHFPVLILIVPGVLSHLQTYFAEPVLMQYMREDEIIDPDAELEQD